MLLLQPATAARRRHISRTALRSKITAGASNGTAYIRATLIGRNEAKKTFPAIIYVTAHRESGSSAVHCSRSWRLMSSERAIYVISQVSSSSSSL